MKNIKKRQTVAKIDSNPKKLDEAISLLPTLSISKFVGSVDVDVVINLKEKQKKESIKGTVAFPNSFGEDKRIVVFCDENDVQTALDAGAIKAGIETLSKDIEKGWFDFDIAIATPAAMPKIVKIGRVLGPKGLMPSPKNGTVTNDIATAVSNYKSGMANFQMTPDQGVVRAKVAKVDMDASKIKDNLITFLQAVYNETKKLSPSPFKKIVVSPTMGAGVKLDVNDIMSFIK